MALCQYLQSWYILFSFVKLSGADVFVRDVSEWRQDLPRALPGCSKAFLRYNYGKLKKLSSASVEISDTGFSKGGIIVSFLLSSVTFLVLQMVAYMDLFTLQGKSISLPFICIISSSRRALYIYIYYIFVHRLLVNARMMSLWWIPPLSIMTFYVSKTINIFAAVSLVYRRSVSIPVALKISRGHHILALLKDWLL